MTTRETICWIDTTSQALRRAKKASKRSIIAILSIRTSLTTNSCAINEIVVISPINFTWLTIWYGWTCTCGTTAETVSTLFIAYLSVLSWGTWNCACWSIKEVCYTINTLTRLTGIVISACCTSRVTCYAFESCAVSIFSRIAWCSTCIYSSKL